MVFSLMGADAAAQHGHEFSTPRPKSSSSNSYSIPRATRNFFSPTTILRSPLSEHQLNSLGPPEIEQIKSVDKPMAVAVITSKAISRDSSPAPRRSSSPCSVDSTELGSQEVSTDFSTCGSPRRGKGRKRASSRPKTTFGFAHPPPLSTKYQKLHIKPRLLLQLQEICPHKRPKPVYEVIPPSRLPTWLGRKLAHTHRPLDKSLGPDDMVVFRVDGHDNIGANEDETWRLREVIGVICPSSGGDGFGELCMGDGATWQASPKPSSRGYYEFSYTDSHGVPQYVRWVSRPMRRKDSNPTSSPTDAMDKRRFIFSPISPHTRRHPVIGTLTANNLEIFDNFKIPDHNGSDEDNQFPPFSPRCGRDGYNDHHPQVEASDSSAIPTSVCLHNLAVISSIWVVFQENWASTWQHRKHNAVISSDVNSSYVLNNDRPMSMPGKQSNEILNSDNVNAMYESIKVGNTPQLQPAFQSRPSSRRQSSRRSLPPLSTSSSRRRSMSAFVSQESINLNASSLVLSSGPNNNNFERASSLRNRIRTFSNHIHRRNSQNIASLQGDASRPNNFGYETCHSMPGRCRSPSGETVSTGVFTRTESICDSHSGHEEVESDSNNRPNSENSNHSSSHLTAPMSSRRYSSGSTEMTLEERASKERERHVNSMRDNKRRSTGTSLMSSGRLNLNERSEYSQTSDFSTMNKDIYVQPGVYRHDSGLNYGNVVMEDRKKPRIRRLFGIFRKSSNSSGSFS